MLDLWDVLVETYGDQVWVTKNKLLKSSINNTWLKNYIFAFSY